MRSVSAQVGTLVQGLADEADVALFEIPHAAVNELRRAARRRFREIRALDERGTVTARHGIDCRTQARRATADDQYVEITAQLREKPVSHRNDYWPP